MGGAGSQADARVGKSAHLMPMPLHPDRPTRKSAIPSVAQSSSPSWMVRSAAEQPSCSCSRVSANPISRQATSSRLPASTGSWLPPRDSRSCRGQEAGGGAAEMGSKMRQQRWAETRHGQGNRGHGLPACLDGPLPACQASHQSCLAQCANLHAQPQLKSG